MCSTVQTINKFNSNKNWLALLPKNVTKLSFASVRMCDYKRLSAHIFVDFCLQTTPTTSEVLRCRSPSLYPPSGQSHTPDVTQTRCRTVAVLRRRCGSSDISTSPSTSQHPPTCGTTPPPKHQA